MRDTSLFHRVEWGAGAWHASGSVRVLDAVIRLFPPIFGTKIDSFITITHLSLICDASNHFLTSSPTNHCSVMSVTISNPSTGYLAVAMDLSPNPHGRFRSLFSKGNLYGLVDITYKNLVPPCQYLSFWNVFSNSYVSMATMLNCNIFIRTIYV